MLFVVQVFLVAACGTAEEAQAFHPEAQGAGVYAAEILLKAAQRVLEGA